MRIFARNIKTNKAMLSNSIRLTDIARLQMFFDVLFSGRFVFVAVFIFDVDEKWSRI